METLKYQAAVVGAGPGGYVCAIRLAQLGIKTVCIERDNWGGVCLNVGCIPSKAFITAAKKYQGVKKMSKMGLEFSSEATVNMAKMQQWKQGIVKKLTGGINLLLKKNGSDQILGNAEFVGGKTIEVTKTDGTVVRVEADNIVIATGSRPIEIPGFSYADDRIMDSTKALALEEIPEKLTVIGGGYIGLEMGMMLSKLGSKVSVVEMASQVLPAFDPEVVKVINRTMKSQKMDVYLNARANGWEEGENSAIVKITTPKGEKQLDADKILVTVGRRPNSEGLAPSGVALDKRGFVIVDEQQQTNVPGIFAIGDITGKTMLAHGASYEAELAAEVIAGHVRKYQARTVPAVVFTDPEIATAGLQEHEAKEKGIDIKTGKVPFAAIGRALTTGETNGFIKTIIDSSDNRVIGVTIVGPNASDLISEAALAIEMDAEAIDIGLTIHPHPTLGEGIMEAAKHALGEAIHTTN